MHVREIVVIRYLFGYTCRLTKPVICDRITAYFRGEDVFVLYDENVKKPSLNKKLFENPTAEYRATPFWAWNGELVREELLHQIDIFQEMGFGGYHMHPRTGLATPYLSEEFMAHVRACVEHGKAVGMLSWLYDEDRYTSGVAGGKVTEGHPEMRRQLMILTSHPDFRPSKEASVIARFDVVLDEDSRIVSYRRLECGECADHKLLTVYRDYAKNSNWRNGQADADTLNEEVTRRFIGLTHEAYAREVGEHFGESVPAIFTDEPYYSRMMAPYFADGHASKSHTDMPYTDDIEETFSAAYGESLVEHLPELLWERADGLPSPTRYRYFDHVSERFASAYSGVVGEWCRSHGIAYIGHMLDESTLGGQSTAVGDVMRSYPHFDIPGIDMLCNEIELTTAKQCQSAVRQGGKAGMVSELDGSTGWDFDFRGHKLHGDWQAALGVTVRVPHLSWFSMKGEAKRDYPASISYQSAWYKEYRYVEDHFARVATALTRGRPIVRVGVIHPVESYWIHHGPNDQTALDRARIEACFANITEWLVRGNIDFDFICEATLPEFCERGDAPLSVGKMAYEAVVVPACETLRATTIERLKAFHAAGGKLIFMGEAPRYVDALPNPQAKMLWAQSLHIPFERSSILEALVAQRDVEIRHPDGTHTSRLIHQLRRDTDGLWLFVAQCGEPYNKDVSNISENTVAVRGVFTPEIWDTQTGEISPVAHVHKDGKTVFTLKLYDYDSALLFLADGIREQTAIPKEPTMKVADGVPCETRYSMTEPNVLLLDMARFSVDGGEWQEREELLRIAGRVREKFGIAKDIYMLQPWAWKQKPAGHTLSLCFVFESDMEIPNPVLALEDGDKINIAFNGETISFRDLGFYTDSAIRKTALSPIRKGKNELILTMPFGEKTDVECCYILGDFGVSVIGQKAKITALPDMLAFDDLTKQGFPFYGGSVRYHIQLQCDREGERWLKIPHYRAAVLAVCVDGERKSTVAYPPYLASLGNLTEGAHEVTVEAFLSRRNCFGNIHCADEKRKRCGHDSWRTVGDAWTYEYRLPPQGIISTPVLYEKKREK